MAWKQNPDTGESYQVPDATPGAGTESGYQNPTAGAKPKVPEYKGPAIPAAPTTPGQPGAGPPLPPQTGPIFPQDAAQPIAFNGGYYNPTTAPFGFDQSTPGVVEQMWENNQNLWFQNPQMDWVDSLLPKFEDPWRGEEKVNDIMGTIANPGAGQQHWTGVQGSFNSMGNDVVGGYGGPNRAEEAYGMTKGMLPGSMQPQFDKYYDRMKDKVMSDVNSQSAARGAYGSNTALNNTIGAGLDVEAQRAKAATDFMLADSQNQMNWQGLLGNQARGADLSGLGIFGSKLQGANFGLDKTKLGSDIAFKSEGMDFDKKKTQAELAFGLDDQALERIGAGVSTAFGSADRRSKQLNDAFDAANVVDNERDERTNTLYGQVADFSSDVQNYISQNYDAIINGDQEAFMAELDAMLAQTADERGWSQYETERIRRDAKDAIDAASKGKEAGLFK
jgi:hypothetical protein